MNKNQPLKRQLHKTLSARRRRAFPLDPAPPPPREDHPSSRVGVWPMALAGLVTVGLVALVVAMPLLPRSISSQTTPSTPLQSSATTPAPVTLQRSALNGMPVDSTASTPLSLVAISIDNSLESRPPSGVDQSPWVFEFPAEATITRLLAVFDPSQDVKEIGPVRSIRPYMIDLAQSLGAVAVHSGGSPDALKELSINAPHRVSINEFSQTPYFWRDPSHNAPHNLYTSLVRLREHPLVKALTPTLMPLAWQDTPATENESTPPKFLTIGYPDPYTVHWVYTPTTHQFLRQASNGSPEQTRSGAMIAVDTVVVQFTDISVLDALGRRSIRTLGEGEAMVISNGTMELAHWLRKNPDDRATLVDVTGAPLPIHPGKIWWSVVSKDTKVSFE